MILSHAEVKKTSITGQSILILKRPGEKEGSESVQLQFPTDIAEYIQRVILIDLELNTPRSYSRGRDVMIAPAPTEKR